MGLCRYLPTPSERMGILWTLLEIDEAIVLEYGPSGTTHYGMSTIGNLGIDVKNKLYVTHIDENDVIMGDSRRLEEALREVDREYKPKYIFVLGSSISSIIATDIKGICNSMEDEINAKMIAFEGGGFRGDYTVGLKEALDTLAHNIVKEYHGEKINKFNIIGACSEEYRIRSNVEEIKRLMKEAFNMELHSAFTLESSITEIENMGKYAINLVIRSEAVEAAKILQEKTNTAYVYGVPYGYSGTIKWLNEVGEMLGIKVADQCIANLKKKAMLTRHFKMYKHFLNKPMKTSIIGNYDLVKGLKCFLKEDVGFEVDNLICLHSLKECNEKEMVNYIKERQKIDTLKSIKDSFVLGDDVSISVISQDNIKIKVSNPSLSGAEVCTHMPIVGDRGADYIVEQIDGYINMLMDRED